MKSKKLIILSQNLPYLPGEHFLETELQFLSGAFEKVALCPVAYQKENKKRAVPKNVQVNPLQRQITNFKALTYLRRIQTILTDSQGMNWLLSEWRHALKFGLRGLLKLCNWVSMAITIRKQLEKHDTEGQSLVYYSYWLSPAAIALAMLKERDPSLTAVSRAHGGDLYAYRHTPAYLPLQQKTISHLSKVFLISSDGKRYLENQYADLDSHTLEVRRLGTLPIENHRPPTTSKGLKIVTCSYMVPVKRLELLIEALMQTKRSIEWTHIGDGPLRDKLTSMASELPKHVQWTFVGNLSNAEVLHYYQQHEVDLFVNISESEGVPVSIMEVFSCGIPVIATDVGGTSELVNEKNGKLLEKDILPVHVTNAIEGFALMSLDKRQAKRKHAFEMWRNHYNAESNYAEFARQLLLLGGSNAYEVHK